MHKHECSGLKNLTNIDASLLSSILVLTHQVLLKMKVQPDYAKDKKVWRSVDSLLSHYDTVDGKKKKDYDAQYVKTMMLCKKLGFEPPQEFSSHHQICHLLSRLRSNVFHIMNEEMATILGTGLYLNCSLLNHSCDPNCTQSFDNGAAVIRALRDIQPGEELTIAYCPLPAPKATRHKELLEYNFTCSCAVCVDPNIEEQFLLDENGKVIDGDDLEDLTKRHELTLDRMSEEWQMENVLRIGDKFLQKSHTHQTNVLRLKVLETMSQTANQIKNIDKMLDCELQLSAIYAKHAPQCAMLGIIYCSIGKLLAYKKQPKKALNFMTKAMAILKYTHDIEGHLVRECSRIAVESKMYIQHAAARLSH